MTVATWTGEQMMDKLIDQRIHHKRRVENGSWLGRNAQLRRQTTSKFNLRREQW